MSKRVIIAGIIALYVISAAPGPAQSGRSRTPNKEIPATSLITETCSIPISITTAGGKTAGNISSTDIIVAENESRQKIISLSKGPANILLILDTSRSLLKNAILRCDPSQETQSSSKEDPTTRTNVTYKLAVGIIDRLAPGDQMAVMTYADKPILLNSWTIDKQALMRSVLWKAKPGNDAYLYDALLQGAETLLSKAEGTRCLVLITDGVNSFGPSKYNEALEALHRAHITVYVADTSGLILKELMPQAYNSISWLDKFYANKGKRQAEMREYIRQVQSGEGIIQEIVRETGGVIWNPESCKDYAGLGNPILEEIGHEFTLTYNSTHHKLETGYRNLRVYSSRSDILIRACLRVYSMEPAATVR